MSLWAISVDLSVGRKTVVSGHAYIPMRQLNSPPGTAGLPYFLVFFLDVVVLRIWQSCVVVLSYDLLPAEWH
jgi:hypothetical protein